MNETEQKAHDEVLRRCRKTPPGAWVMRNGVQKQKPCNVVNLSPGGYAPHRDIVADGETWLEVLRSIAKEAMEQS